MQDYYGGGENILFEEDHQVAHSGYLDIKNKRNKWERLICIEYILR